MAKLLGQGIYSIPEASRLSGIPGSAIRRWVFGFTSKRAAHGRAHYRGLWQPDYHDEEEPALSFHDLLEVRFVGAFRKQGVSLQAIRLAAAHAREILDTEHPFTCRQFLTDGRGIFAEIAPELGDAGDRRRLLDLAKRQYVFREIVSPSLYSGIDYGRGGAALRWFPLPRSRRVVLDPGRAFGKPILYEYGVPTEALAHAAQTERDIRRVARLYKVPAGQVETAISFEQRIADHAGACRQ